MIGHSAALLQPLSEAIRRHVMAASKLHAGDTLRASRRARAWLGSPVATTRFSSEFVTTPSSNRTRQLHLLPGPGSSTCERASARAGY
jgi:hypothetical protein